LVGREGGDEEMATLEQTAKYVRSKNAGPFSLTFDIFCDDTESYEKIKNSSNITPALFARTYHVDEKDVIYYYCPDIHAIKISIPRPTIQGNKYERDMHQCQQYLLLLDIEV
jgi:hypothetical protein